MIRFNRHVTTRPEYFTLDPNHQLSRELVFAGLGRFPRSYTYDDAMESIICGAANPGTLTNMDPATDWVWSPELKRYVLDFDGSNDCVVTGGNIGITGSTDRTVSFWHKTSDTSSDLRFVCWGNRNSYEEFSIMRDSPGDNDKIRLAITAGNRIWNWSCYDGEWHHFLIRLVGSNTTDAEAFGDGIALTVSTENDQTLNTTDTPLYIGFISGDARYYVGQMGDILIWDRALTDGEIAILADRSDPMLDGWLRAPRRRVWKAAALVGNPWYAYAQQ